MIEHARFVSRFALLIGFTASLALPLAASSQTQTFEGVAVTGINRRLGAPVFNTGPGTTDIGFNTVGAHVPGAAAAAPLEFSSPESTLLATFVDPFFLTVFGAPPPSADKLNVPLRSVGAIKTPDGMRGPLRGHLSVSPLEPSRVANTPPITLGQWLEAKGTAKVRCTGARGFIEIRFENLIPHGLYTIWSVFQSPSGLFPVPMGGAPNAFVTDPRGEARFERALSYCPLQPLPSGERLAIIEVIYHSDHSLYGGVPEQFLAGLPPGAVTHAHMDIPILATPLP